MVNKEQGSIFPVCGRNPKVYVAIDQGHSTVRFAECLRSERHYPPQKFGFNCEQKLAFSLAIVHLTSCVSVCLDLFETLSSQLLRDFISQRWHMENYCQEYIASSIMNEILGKIIYILIRVSTTTNIDS